MSKLAIKGLLVAALHLALVVGVAGKFAVDRATLPRAWARTAPVDPRLPIRGRYVLLRLQGPVEGVPPQALRTPLAFFIPDGVRDPSVRDKGEELWVEVSVPKSGIPRPIRLGVKKDGVLTPLEIK